ncbi:hypothetical protein EDB81DRAFT_765737 [Dactylonectria macrodidyma]|uniref:Uncharacterized protein n=1 Tax=Dactylonectria macrodidyma TaxID=307937 RepID=A0A9P9IL38_9HYPO|nr:hypothetical protein EDB81DRAFT_765737 [Dactylonectria macrodidyma]
MSAFLAFCGAIPRLFVIGVLHWSCLKRSGPEADPEGMSFKYKKFHKARARRHAIQRNGLYEGESHLVDEFHPVEEHHLIEVKIWEFHVIEEPHPVELEEPHLVGESRDIDEAYRSVVESLIHVDEPHGAGDACSSVK